MKFDLDEMLSGISSVGATSGVNLVMQIDGWYASPPNITDNIDGTIRMSATPIIGYESIGEKNTGNPYVLSDFVNWATEEYPTNHCALIVWDHGGGFIGAAADWTSGDDILDMSDFTTSINNFNEHLDIIGFDACLMGMIEVAYQFRDATDIFVASEPNEPITGWEYAGIMESIFSNPEIDSKNLASTMVESYQEEYQDGLLYSEGLSAVDLTSITYLSDAIDNFVSAVLDEASPIDWHHLQSIVLAAPAMGTTSPYNRFKDLGCIMSEIAESDMPAAIIDTAQAVNTELDNAVLNEWHDDTHPESTGLTIYLPNRDEAIDSQYNNDIDFLVDTQWDEFLDKLVTPVPIFLALQLEESSDSGIVGDRITNTTKPHFAGFTFPGLKVWADLNDNDIFESTSDYADDQGYFVIDGQGYYDINNTLKEGNHRIVARTRRYDGDYIYAALEITIDTTSPYIEEFVVNDRISEISISFNEPMDRSFVENTDNYLLTCSGGDSNFHDNIPIIIDSASYGEATYTVTLTINNGEELPNDLYRLVINNANLMTDVAGNLLEGNTGATEYVYEFWAGPMPVEIPKKGIRFYGNDYSSVTVILTGGNGFALMGGEDLRVLTTKKGTEIFGDGLFLAGVNLTDSNEKSKLTIKSKDEYNQTTLGGVTGDSLGGINAKGIDLTGDINLTGSLGSLVIDDIYDDTAITTESPTTKGFSLKADSIGDRVDFDIAGTVKNFQAASFNSGSLMADNIGQIKIKEGGLGADVEATRGDILGITAQWNITGNISASGTIKKISTQYGDFTGAARAGNEIGTIQAYNLTNALLSASNNIKNVNIKNDILDTYIMAGYDIGADCALGLQETDGGDIPGSGDIGSVIAKGEFARSYICAGKLPYTSDTMTALPSDQDFTGNFGSIGKVKFGSIAYQDATENFGLYAVNGIKPFKVGKDEVESKDYFVVDYLL